MNWTAIVLLTVVGLVFIAVEFYLPGFVLGSIGAVLMLFATAICYGSTGNRDQTILLFCVEVALGFGVGYASIKFFPQTTVGRKMILAKMQTGASAPWRRRRICSGAKGSPRRCCGPRAWR